MINIENIPLSFGFEQIAIKQKKGLLKSRLDANLKSEIFRGVFISSPIMASNMDTVCNADFCIKLNNLGALGIMHRVGDQAAEIKKIANSGCKIVAASIGLDDEYIDELVSSGANALFLDIAHGYTEYAIEYGKNVKQRHPDVKLIMGNTTNPEMLREVSDFADAVKVGIAQGFACETKNTAGCTEKQFSAIYQCKELSKSLGLPMISDGGIREPADYVKSIAAGANSAMAGMIFARCPESAARIEYKDSGAKKVYEGMSSRKVQQRWNGIKSGTCPEGTIRYLDIGEPADALLQRYMGALRSGISYAGGIDISSFQNIVEFVRI